MKANVIASALIVAVGVLACIALAAPGVDSTAGLAGVKSQSTSQDLATLAPLQLALLEQELVPDAPRLVLTEESKQQMVDLELARLLQMKSAAQAALHQVSQP